MDFTYSDWEKLIGEVDPSITSNGVYKMYLLAKETTIYRGVPMGGTIETNTLANLMTSKNTEVASTAMYFMYELLQSTSQPDKTNLLLAIAAVAPEMNCVGSYVSLLGRIIIDDYTSQALAAKGEHFKYIDPYSSYCSILEGIIITRPTSVFYVVSFFKSIDPIIRYTVFGDLIKRFLFDFSTKPFSVAVNSGLIWKMIQELKCDQYKRFYLLLWSELNNPLKLMPPFMNYRRIDDHSNEDMVVLLLSYFFCRAMRKGFISMEMEELYENGLRVCDNYILSLAAMILVLELPQCSVMLMEKYLKFFERNFIDGSVCVEVALLMEASLATYSVKDNGLEFHFIGELINKIHSRIHKLEKVADGEICDPAVLYVCGSIPMIKQAQLVLRLFSFFNLRKSASIYWVNSLPKVDPCIRPYYLILYLIFTTSNNMFLRKASYQKLKKWRALRFFPTLVSWIRCHLQPSERITLFLALVKAKTTKLEEIEVLKMVVTESKSFAIGYDLMQQSMVTNPIVNTDPTPIIFADEVLNDNKKTALIRKIMKSQPLHSEDCIRFLNKFVNDKKCNETADIPLSYCIDSLVSACLRGSLNIEVVWEQLIKLLSIAGPSTTASIFKLLRIIPSKIKEEDSFDIVYKSAKILWHFASKKKYLVRLALEALKQFKLTDFDASFLGPSCRGHLPTSLTSYRNRSPERPINRKSYQISIQNAIPVDCWIHIMEMVQPISQSGELMKNLIKAIRIDDTFHVNYHSLHQGLDKHLQNHHLKLCEDMPDKDDITFVCLQVLNSAWCKNLQSSRYNMKYLLQLMKFGYDRSIRLLAVKIAFKHFLICKDARDAVYSWTVSLSDGSECLFLLYKLHFVLTEYANEKRTFLKILPYLEKGYKYYFYKDDVNDVEVVNQTLKVFSDHEINKKRLKMILRYLIILFWTEGLCEKGTYMLGSLFVQLKIRFLLQMPVRSECWSSNMKYILYWKLMALKHKSLYIFEHCIPMAFSNSSLQDPVKDAICEIILSCGSKQLPLCRIWLSRSFLLFLKDGSNYAFELYVLCLDRIYGTAYFGFQQSLDAAIDRFPYTLYISSHACPTIGCYLFDLQSWLNRSILKGRYKQAILLGMMSIKNSPLHQINCQPLIKFNLLDHINEPNDS